jgi:hypothetical protein
LANPFLAAALVGESDYLKFAVLGVLDLRENLIVVNRYVETDGDNVLVS